MEGIMKEKKFLICNHCGNLVGIIKSSGVPIICCGEPMNEIVANTTDASVEKHLPVISIIDNVIEIMVGSTIHPMVPEHLIEWIYLQTEKGGQRKILKSGDSPKVTFVLKDDKPVSVFAYCNLHGLWKSDF